MQITKNTHVTCDFKLTGGDGSLISRSTEDEPLTYVHGHQSLLPTLEAELDGKSTGDSIDVTIEPADGFGPRDESLVHEVSRDQFPVGEDIQPGMTVVARSEAGESALRVVKVTDENITLDENHPLAGITLRFEVTVLGVREATAEEQSQA